MPLPLKLRILGLRQSKRLLDRELPKPRLRQRRSDWQKKHRLQLMRPPKRRQKDKLKPQHRLKRKDKQNFLLLPKLRQKLTGWLLQSKLRD